MSPNFALNSFTRKFAHSKIKEVEQKRLWQIINQP